MRSKQSLFFAVLTAFIVTLPLMSLLYLAEQVGDLPFAAFDLFDWMARSLPGDVITHTIETLVDIITRLNLGETSSAAKTLETLAALSMFATFGVVTGSLIALFVSRIGTHAAWGALAGAVASIPIILLSLDQSADTSSAPESVIALWHVMAFVTWGVAIQWSSTRLIAIADANRKHADAVESGAATSPSTQMISRRAFLIRVGSTTATLTVLGAGIGRYLEYLDEKEYQDLIEQRRAAVLPQGLPNQDADLEPAPGTRPEYTPLEDHYRIDISVRPIELDGVEWQLAITGLVDTPLALTLDDLHSNYEEMDQFVTLACISNPLGGDLTSTTRWTGVLLQDVLATAGIQEGATHIKITSADGFYETVALELINSDRRVMLAYHWDGIPLLYKHGFPLRIYIPDLYGMKQPKWITDIEVMDHDEDGYWVTRGWDKTARMRTTSVVDVAASDMPFERDGVTYVPVGGIAHAGARGISKVEVQIDGGEWVEAQTRTPLSDTTWVIWRYDWPFESGRHTFAVRCYDGDGVQQVAESSRTHPSGATGIHTLTRTI